ncbi:hypothetical protein DY000_02009533 [Brassica cretica]|uniref:Uncharacterized protein n=1 Tax=Brassica cretica TaxID=69181 RepID=A0ABQ7C1S9_BRACR|nr:hypothetical protein DY000_02009533 [Brassica cretica]
MINVLAIACEESNNCAFLDCSSGIPLPYLIRPRRKLPVYDSYSLYDDYIGYLSNKVGLKSDEGDDETSSLEKGNESNAMLCGTGSLSDEEYVVMDRDVNLRARA